MQRWLAAVISHFELTPRFQLMPFGIFRGLKIMKIIHRYISGSRNEANKE